MTTLEEKRVYGEQTGKREVYVASGLGLAVASVADDRLGGVELAWRGDARDVTTRDGGVAVATDADVLVAADGDDFEVTDFGPATAVEFDGETPLAAGEDGRVARRGDDDWTTVGTLDAEVRAIDGDLLATSEGMVRVREARQRRASERASGEGRPASREADLQAVGLADARDVSTSGLPLAATASGLYKLGNGWMDELDGDFRAVAADPATEPGSLERAHAATPEAVFASRDGAWRERDLPADERVVALAVSGAVYAVTEAGTLLIDAGDGWRAHPLGVREVRQVAVA
jgi:hypothetical protein